MLIMYNVNINYDHNEIVDQFPININVNDRVVVVTEDMLSQNMDSDYSEITTKLVDNTLIVYLFVEDASGQIISFDLNTIHLNLLHQLVMPLFILVKI